MNYINHASGDKANVKVRWPDKTLIAHIPDWLEKEPEWFSRSQSKIGLSFEYVALRDIEEGEEIFMDYGPEWEEAWKKHVAEWEPLPDADEYFHSSAWPEPYFRTKKELRDEPYPDNLKTMCNKVSYKVSEDGSNHWVPNPQKGGRVGHEVKRWYCNVLERFGNEEDGFAYDVEVQMGDEEHSDEWVEIKNFNSTLIFLTDKPYTTDWHMPNVFRHPIAIPDDVFPEAWINYPENHVLGSGEHKIKGKV